MAAQDWDCVYKGDGPALGEWETMPVDELEDEIDRLILAGHLIASDMARSSPYGLYFDRLCSAGWLFAEELGASVTCPLCGEHVIAHKTARFFFLPLRVPGPLPGM